MPGCSQQESCGFGLSALVDGLVGVGQEEHELGLSNAFKTVNFRQVQQASLDSVNEVWPTFILFSHQGEHSEAGLN
jgi:hypothetical protein